MPIRVTWARARAQGACTAHSCSQIPLPPVHSAHACSTPHILVPLSHPPSPLSPLSSCLSPFPCHLFPPPSPVPSLPFLSSPPRRPPFSPSLPPPPFTAQGTLPCVSAQGATILAGGARVATAPDGNGGVYTALAASGALRAMAQRGVRYVHAFSIDNALARPGDAAFVGACVGAGAQCGAQCIWKRDAGTGGLVVP
ncbi:nucleotide-diphospho-sugar transferase [Tribonema minus]|uniref:UDP-N-acetylglucosamine diphosphorylase n=1 Tax=Tribonema minus TaxID=303371 RepID=A0A835YGW4_9STRA|nr:nucleotide-diphospho-sugar transferase [Tribonema minus]